MNFFLFFTQLYIYLSHHAYSYIGQSRTTVIQNRDTVKELRIGMLIATAGENVAKVGRVHAIPPNPMLDTTITIHWFNQERALHN